MLDETVIPTLETSISLLTVGDDRLRSVETFAEFKRIMQEAFPKVKAPQRARAKSARQKAYWNGPSTRSLPKIRTPEEQLESNRRQAECWAAFKQGYSIDEIADTIK